MRRQMELKVVPREETGKGVTATPEARAASVTERGILATLGEMERLIDETLHRPFFGLNAQPMRQLLRNLGNFGEFAPSVDIFEEKNDVVVKAELPGIKREDINVELIGNSMVISGEKKSEEKVDRKGYYRVERSYGSFHRALTLPEGIDANKAKASFKDGVLEVRIPKTTEQGNIRRIAIQ